MNNYADVYLFGQILGTHSFLLKDGFLRPDEYSEIKEQYFLPGGETGTAATVLDSLGTMMNLFVLQVPAQPLQFHVSRCHLIHQNWKKSTIWRKKTVIEKITGLLCLKRQFYFFRSRLFLYIALSARSKICVIIVSFPGVNSAIPEARTGPEFDFLFSQT